MAQPHDESGELLYAFSSICSSFGPHFGGHSTPDPACKRLEAYDLDREKDLDER